MQAWKVGTKGKEEGFYLVFQVIGPDMVTGLEFLVFSCFPFKIK